MLKYYIEERNAYKEEYKKQLTHKEVRIIFDKLCRHFKIHPYLRFGRGSKACYEFVQLSNKWGLNFGVLCHEIAHSYCAWHDMKRGHNKCHKRAMKRIIHYCKKKNFWLEELQSKTEIKPLPAMPTTQEQQATKIEKARSALARYEKKLQYYTKLYSNKIKKAKKRIAMLEYHQNKINQ